MDLEKLNKLKKDALGIRKLFLKMHFDAGAGHIGSGLSCIDILTFLYGNYIQGDDKFILSKGHGASSLYATLKHFDRLSQSQFDSYYKDGTLLPAHPAPRALAEIPAATGSLGHGFSIANGIAYAAQYLRNVDATHPARTVVLLSDGECNEGSVWEAALFAGQHKLNSLTVIVDANGLQGFGKTTEILNLEPMREKWENFGFVVSEIDGHDFSQLEHAFTSIEKSDKRPRCIVARTVKGKSISFMENKMEWHYLPMKEPHFKEAMAELEALI
jgi:transketolase